MTDAVKFKREPFSPTFLLLFGCVFILIGLAWQLFNLVTQSRDSRQELLSDYSKLATEEFTRRIMVEIGYREYLPAIQAWLKHVKKWTR